LAAQNTNRGADLRSLPLHLLFNALMSLTSTVLREHHRNNFLISTDKAKLDLPLIHDYLARQSYWAENIPMAVVQQSIENSLTFGIYQQEQQVGYARVITDFATYGYLADVFVLEEFRGRGLSKWLMDCIFNQTPELQGFRRWTLATADAHGLYEQVGFAPLAKPERHMEKVNFTKYAD
jgi:GNAT superfamily N-acetyltransferase